MQMLASSHAESKRPLHRTAPPSHPPTHPPERSALGSFAWLIRSTSGTRWLAEVWASPSRKKPK
jgi:hypothetical protein